MPENNENLLGNVKEVAPEVVAEIGEIIEKDGKKIIKIGDKEVEIKIPETGDSSKEAADDSKQLLGSNCCEYIVGNSKWVPVTFLDCDVKVHDIDVKKKKDKVRLSGQVVDCNGYGVSNVLVNLLKYHSRTGETVGVAHTITDCDGNYIFEVDKPSIFDFYDVYKIIVGKAAKGAERPDLFPFNNCEPCKNPCS